MLLTVKGLCFNVIFVFASLHVQSLLLFSSDKSLQLSPSTLPLKAVEDPRNCIKSFLRLRGGSEIPVDKSSGKFLTFKIRCPNTRWGQSGGFLPFLFEPFCVEFTACVLGRVVGPSWPISDSICVVGSRPPSSLPSMAAFRLPPAAY
jgi:hypothetical protein